DPWWQLNPTQADDRGDHRDAVGGCWSGLLRPRGVYVTDMIDHQVVKLPPGSSKQAELPWPVTGMAFGVAVDAAGNVYITGKGRVLKLAAGSDTQTVLPFPGLASPTGVAVDTAGSVYVTDTGRVLKLPAS